MNKMIVHIDTFAPIMLNRIGKSCIYHSHYYSIGEWVWQWRWQRQIKAYVTKSFQQQCSQEHHTQLLWRAWIPWIASWSPSNQVWSKVYRITSSRLTSVLTASPVRIRVDNDGGGISRRAKEETTIHNTLQVLENTFDNKQMSSTRSMYKLRNNMNWVCNVRLSHGQIL